MSQQPVNLDWDSLSFSMTETDHMVIATCDAEGCWSDLRVRPFGDLSISPAAAVLNYGQGLFEGMKAYRTVRERIVTFRPEANAERMQMGARRLGMPEVPTELYIEAIQTVVASNARWVPPMGKGALYVRPLLLGTGPRLGVSPAPSYTFVVYTSPVGPYFKGGLSPISLLVSDRYHRAAPGGSGGVKAIGNYAPGMMPSKEAKADGYAEVIYLDAEHHRFVEEVGAANFFCIHEGRVLTSELTGTILPGVTRQSIIELARARGYEVVETRVDVDVALESDECFCTGTAAVISPIGSIRHGNRESVYNGGAVGPVSRELYEALTAIQQERAADEHGWLHEVAVTAKALA